MIVWLKEAGRREVVGGTSASQQVGHYMLRERTERADVCAPAFQAEL